MSSYLTFYLVPKKTRKKYDFNKDDGHTETEVELSTGTPLALMSYSRNNEIYRAFNETLNPAYAGMEEKYTELTTDGCKRVIEDLENEIKSIEKRLNINYKMLKEGGYSSELWENIHSMEDYLSEQKETLESVRNISSLVYECTEGYNDFEKVLINVD
jgi:hypothetical protein